MRSYFARGKDSTDKQRDEALFINNCGYYRELTAAFSVSRPHGRSDYQLLFCARGSIAVGKHTLTDGDMYLFLPHERQEYTYHPAPDARYYWLHFTGTAVDSLLAELHVCGGAHACGARTDDAEALFRMIAHTIGEPVGESEVFAAALLRPLLLLMVSKNPAMPFRTALRALDDLQKEVNVSELAAHYGMSREHFIRTFSAYTGQTPYRYRQSKRIALAKMLLADTALSVSLIAAEVGLADPQYFSRLFKSATGLSPAAYRKSKRGDETPQMDKG
ncbi:MAG: AraC family transcriptional regulator [Clostridia bacterium]|nr:AraC family transcriptional regulator [Clostridia bacterium]